jgi:hypothetical protein
MRASGKMAPDANFPDFETMKRVASRGTVHLSQTAKVALEVETWAKMCPVIKSRRWMVLRAAAGTGFVTADHPISLSWISAERRAAMWPPGFGLPGTEVIFPLSAELALHGSYEGEDNEVYIPADVVALINGAALANAENQAYGVSGAAAYKLSEQDDPATLAEALKDQALATLRSSLRAG